MSLVHGSYSTYTNHGCRCAACRAASTEYALAARRRREGTLAPDDTRHGLYSTYFNHACRCEKCKAARAAYERAYYQKKKEATR